MQLKPATRQGVKRPYRKRGSPLTLEWLKSFCTIDESKGCWLWHGFVRTDGYGAISIKRQLCLAHRAMFEIACGPIPNGLDVCHSCGIRNCINPDHLWTGTNADNMADRNRKSRQAFLKGELNGFHRLKTPDVVQILTSKEPGSVLAEKFSVSPSTVSAVRQRKSWRHVTI